MDFSSQETWLDLIIIVVALGAIVVVVVMALRLLKSRETSESFPQPSVQQASVAPKDPPEPSTSVDSAKPAHTSPTPKSKTVFDQLAEMPSSRELSQPAFDKISKSAQQITGSDGFVAEKLHLESASRLVLSLKNTEAKVVFKRVSPGPNNEVTITHVQEAQPTNSLLPEYPQGSSIFFHLDADNVLGRTFQFTLYYGDLQGNLYRQDISGLGKEYPIIDPVVKIA